MSPTILARPAMTPSQSLRGAGGRGGPTSATGSPKRVRSTGLPVRFTRWRTARQVALNLDTGMLSMTGKLAWSEMMVKPAQPGAAAGAAGKTVGGAAGEQVIADGLYPGQIWRGKVHESPGKAVLDRYRACGYDVTCNRCRGVR